MSRQLALAAACGLLVAMSSNATAQKSYPSADAAAGAMVAALRASDGSMSEVLGQDYKRFIPTEGVDLEDVQRFLAAWDEKHALVSGKEADGQFISVGKNDWKLPIPIVEDGGSFRFDVKSGAEIIRTRRVGRNELAAIKALLAVYDAQREYAQFDRNGDGYLAYAQRIVSTPGSMDGLYWAALDDEPPSPLGPLVDDMDEEDRESGAGYHGYHFRMLKAQGPAARGGERSYLVGGRMRGGFAAVAWPVDHDDTGVMTFIVNQNGIVYQKDLGAETSKLAPGLQRFDPDARWIQVDESDEI